MSESTMHAGSSRPQHGFPARNAAFRQRHGAGGALSSDPGSKLEPLQGTTSKQVRLGFASCGLADKSDKSLKKSIDVDLQGACRILNGTANFRTTSCCSGRIVVFRQTWATGRAKTSEERLGTRGDIPEQTLRAAAVETVECTTYSYAVSGASTVATLGGAKLLGRCHEDPDDAASGSKPIATKYGGSIVYASHTTVDDDTVCGEILRRLEAGAVHYEKHDIPEALREPASIISAQGCPAVIGRAGSSDVFSFVETSVPSAAPRASTFFPAARSSRVPPLPFPSGRTILRSACATRGGTTRRTTCSGQDDSFKAEQMEDSISHQLSSQPLVYLKVEPLIIHVECATLADATALLAAAVSSGLKHSGLSVGKKRCVVAIRGSQRLEVPIAAVTDDINKKSSQQQPDQRFAFGSTSEAARGTFAAPCTYTSLKRTENEAHLSEDGYAEDEIEFLGVPTGEDWVDLVSRHEETPDNDTAFERAELKPIEQLGRKRCSPRRGPHFEKVTVLVTESYLRFILRVCNGKLAKNKAQIHRLERTLERFVQRHTAAVVRAEHSSCRAITIPGSARRKEAAASGKTSDILANQTAIAMGSVAGNIEQFLAKPAVKAAPAGVVQTAAEAMRGGGPAAFSETAAGAVSAGAVEMSREATAGAAPAEIAQISSKAAAEARSAGIDEVSSTSTPKAVPAKVRESSTDDAAEGVCAGSEGLSGEATSDTAAAAVEQVCAEAKVVEVAPADTVAAASDVAEGDKQNRYEKKHEIFGGLEDIEIEAGDGHERCRMSIGTWNYMPLKDLAGGEMLQLWGCACAFSYPYLCVFGGMARGKRVNTLLTYDVTTSRWTKREPGDDPGHNDCEGMSVAQSSSSERSEEEKQEKEKKIVPPGRWRHGACVQPTPDEILKRTIKNVRDKSSSIENKREGEGEGKEGEEQQTLALKYSVDSAAQNQDSTEEKKKKHETLKRVARETKKKEEEKCQRSYFVWVYGGVTGAQPLDERALHDLWRLKLSLQWRRNTLSEVKELRVEEDWECINPSGQCPPALHSHTMVATQEKLLLLGGIEKTDPTAATPLSFRKLYCYSFLVDMWICMKTQGIPESLSPSGLIKKVDTWNNMHYPQRRFSHRAMLLERQVEVAINEEDKEEKDERERGKLCITGGNSMEYMLVVMGGCDGSEPTSDTWTLNLQELRWQFITELPCAESSWRCRSGASFYKDEKNIHFYLIGGGGTCFTFGSHADPAIQINIPISNLFSSNTILSLQSALEQKEIGIDDVITSTSSSSSSSSRIMTVSQEKQEKQKEEEEKEEKKEEGRRQQEELANEGHEIAGECGEKANQKKNKKKTCGPFSFTECVETSLKEAAAACGILSEKSNEERIKKNFSSPSTTSQLTISGKYEVLGDILLLRSSDHETIEKWIENLKVDASAEELQLVRKIFWMFLSQKTKMRGFAIQGIVSGNTRQSGAKMISEGGGLVLHRENNVIYKFDLTKCMFSSGNGTERRRFVNLIYKGGEERPEKVVDLFCGIGYFSLAALARVPANRLALVYACDWNEEALKYFREGIRLNRVDPSRVYLFRCDSTLKPGSTERTYILPVPREDDRKALRCQLSPGGTGHPPLVSVSAGASFPSPSTCSLPRDSFPVRDNGDHVALPTALLGIADRVSLGLLPDSTRALATALLLINKCRGGILHVHGVSGATPVSDSAMSLRPGNAIYVEFCGGEAYIFRYEKGRREHFYEYACSDSDGPEPLRDRTPEKQGRDSQCQSGARVETKAATEKMKRKQMAAQRRQIARMYLGYNRGSRVEAAQVILEELGRVATTDNSVISSFSENYYSGVVWTFCIEHVEKVKSFSPQKYHYVVDIRCKRLP